MKPSVAGLCGRIPVGALLFCLSASLYLLTGRGMIGSHDASILLKTTEAIVERGSFELVDPGSVGDSSVAKGLEGRRYSKYGIGKSLINIPAFVAGKLVESLLPNTPKGAAVHFCVSQVNPLVSAGVVVALFLMCRTLGFSESGSVCLGLLYGFASIAWPYSKDDMTEPLAALLVTLGVTAALRLRMDPSRNLAVTAALALGGAVATRHILVIVPLMVGVSLVVSAWRLGRPRPTHLAWFFGILGAAACLLGWFNQARFGSMTETGYDKNGGGSAGFTFLSPDFPLHCLAYLISPGAGLLVFMPFLVLVPLGIPKLWHRNPLTTAVLLSCFTANLALSSAYKFWDGSWGWGPRFLLPFLPLLFPFFGEAYRSLSTSRHLRPWVLSACCVAFAINLMATLAPWERYLTKLSLRRSGGEIVDVTWSIPDSQIAHQPGVFWEVFTLPAADRDQLSNGHSDPASALASSRSLNLPSIWPIRVAYEGIPVVAILAASGFLILVAAVSGSLLWFRLRPKNGSNP